MNVEKSNAAISALITEPVLAPIRRALPLIERPTSRPMLLIALRVLRRLW